MRSAFLAMALSVAGSALPAHGSGNSLLSESSARSLGSAGAGKETLSESAIGIFYNPSVGARSEGTTVAVSGTYLIGVSEFDVTTNFGGQSVGTDFVPAAVLGTVAIQHSLSSNLAMGLTVGPSFGLSVDYPEAWSAGALVTQAELTQIAISPVLSWQPGNGLAIGIAPILEIGALDYRSNTPFGSVTRSYDRSIALGVLLGAHVKLASETELGLTFRYSPDHSYRGQRSGLLPSRSRIDIDSPNVLSLGIRQALTSDFALLASTSWFGWSDTQQQIIIEPGAGNTTIARNWRDGWQLSLGFEYDLSSKISIRSGFAYSNNFIPASRRVPDAPFDAQKRFGAGLSYRMTGDRSWDFAYGFNDLGQNKLHLSGADYGGLSSTGQLDFTGHVFSMQYNMSLNDLPGN
ncbi:MAG: OmpP1/FadL family transporter [Hyphomicrobiaceae bacterium]